MRNNARAHTHVGAQSCGCDCDLVTTGGAGAHWGRVCLFALAFKATEFVCMRSLRAKSEFPGDSVVRAVVCRGWLVAEMRGKCEFLLRVLHVVYWRVLLLSCVCPFRKGTASIIHCYA